jgi:hypothetical protein
MYLKLGILLFWALWFFLAFLSNFFDLLKHFSLIPHTWMFASNNYSAVVAVLSIYNLPALFIDFIFSCVILFEGVISFVFWTAFFKFKKSSGKKLRWTNSAFMLSALLWALFLLIEEICSAYTYESKHLLLFLGALICLMAIHNLPVNKGEI